MLNEQFHKIVGIRKVAGDIGVEIECEGKTVSWLPGQSVFWNVVPDGSLRNNGVEYIFRKPIKIGDLDAAMAEFTKLTKEAKFADSPRTSVHVHRNATGCTLQQVYNVYGFHWLVENMLVEANGANRVGNMYCLRIADAEDLYKCIIKGISTKEYFRRAAGDHYRYSALNPAALLKYGSFEWRFIKGITDPHMISMWVRNLFKSSSEAMKFSTLSDLIDKFRKEDSATFLQHFYEEPFLQFIYKEVPQWRVRLEEGFPFAYELSKKLTEHIEYLKKPQYAAPFIASSHEDLPIDPELKVYKPKMKSFTLNNATVDPPILADDDDGDQQEPEPEEGDVFIQAAPVVPLPPVNRIADWAQPADNAGVNQFIRALRNR
jgi:hypothetical protein